MTPTKLDRTLERYLKCELNRQESAKVEAWLTTMRKKEYCGDNIGNGDEEALFRKIQTDSETINDIMRFCPSFRAKRPFLEKHRSWVVIIFVLLVILFGAFLFKKSATIPIQRRPPANSSERIVFNHGAILLLSNYSSLRYGALVAEVGDREGSAFDLCLGGVPDPGIHSAAIIS